MPIYEYRCAKGHTFDVMQRMSEDPVTVCEVCARPVQRVLQPVAVHFKGSGFYNTDYGTKKRQRETAAAAEGSKKASDKDSSGDKASSGDKTSSDSGSSASGSSGSGSSDSGSSGSGSPDSTSKSKDKQDAPAKSTAKGDPVKR